MTTTISDLPGPPPTGTPVLSGRKDTISTGWGGWLAKFYALLAAPLEGTKVYYVSDTLGGATNRKLTFKNGILVAET